MRNRRLSKLLALIWAAPALALAQPKPFDEADWARIPSHADALAVWPAGARPGVYEGGAELECAIAADKTPTACRVVQEEPAGQGFGAAALSLTGKFQLKSGPASADSRFTIPLHLVSPKFVPPDWQKRPSPDDFLSVFPRVAMEKGQSGKATISCKVNLQGRLFDCEVVAEEPADANFGSAALAMTPQLLMRPATLDGKPVVSSVRIPLNFKTYGPGRTSGMKTVINAARDWAEAPSYADVAAAYPARAKAKVIGGRATLACEISSKGNPRNCIVISEEPKGAGFGTSAEKLAQKFRLEPERLGDIKTSDLQLQLPVTFAAEMLVSATPTIGKPLWAALPTAEEAGDAYPAAARKANVRTGRAVLLCQVQALGKVACQIQSETPAGFGFGEAAMKMSPFIRLATWTTEGLPVIGGQVRVPLRFELPESEPAPQSQKPEP